MAAITSASVTYFLWHHPGTIEVSSQPGQGATFSVVVPLDEAAATYNLGIQFIYAELLAQVPVSVVIDLPAGSLNMMPQVWRDRLHLAATQADQATLLHLLEALPSDQADLRQSLQSWVANFQFDKIIPLTRSDDE